MQGPVCTSVKNPNIQCSKMSNCYECVAVPSRSFPRILKGVCFEVLSVCFQWTGPCLDGPDGHPVQQLVEVEWEDASDIVTLLLQRITGCPVPRWAATPKYRWAAQKKLNHNQSSHENHRITKLEFIWNAVGSRPTYRPLLLPIEL